MNGRRLLPRLLLFGAIVAAVAAGGIDHLFFTSGSEIGFFQEATAKARALGHNKPVRLVTVPHEHASLNAALGFATAYAVYLGVLGGRVAAGGIDFETIKLRFWPQQTIDTTKETIEWAKARNPLGPKS